MDEPKFAQSSVVSTRRLSPSEIATVLAESKAFGIDLDHLRANLQMTPARRLAMLQAGLRTVETLRRARPL